jgi:glycosyltransferase involved in cell wall biosynthesis
MPGLFGVFFIIYTPDKVMKMDMNRKPMRVLWFANTPGLSVNYLKISMAAGGWISSLQNVLEEVNHCELGFVFYSEESLAPFEYGKTWYFPVQKLGNSKKKRLLNRLTCRTEYDENMPNFLKAIELFKPDIIHVHGTEFSFGLIRRQVSHIPIVVSIQGNLTVYGKKYFSGLNMPGLGRRLQSGYPFFQADYKIWQKRAAIEQEILRKTEFVFGRTDWDRRICLALAPGASYFHVDEVIRPRFYVLERKPGVNAVPVFLTTSGPSFYKGFETVLDTARILTDNGMTFTWLVAGLKEGHPLVKLMLQSRGVGDLAALNIRLLGTLPEEELARQLTEADAFVQVSHIENSPNSLCEAMLAGIPVIASFAGGTSSLVQDGVHGVLVQDGDPYALAGALQELVRYPERYQPMADEARRVARRRHDPGTIVADMVEKYADIIKKHALKNELKTP